MANDVSMNALVSLGQRLGEHFADRRTNPQDDVFTDLVEAEVTDENGEVRRLTDGELADFGILLFSAGSETVARHLGWAASVLDAYPDQRAELAKDFSLIPNAVEEILRYEPPSPVNARWTTRDVTVDDVTIPANSRVDPDHGLGRPRRAEVPEPRRARHPPKGRPPHDLRLRRPLLPRRRARPDGRPDRHRGDAQAVARVEGRPRATPCPSTRARYAAHSGCPSTSEHDRARRTPTRRWTRTLAAWLAEVTGTGDLTINRSTGGASRAGYAVDAHLADGTTRELWLRTDPGFGPQSATLYSLRREAAVYRGARTHADARRRARRGAPRPPRVPDAARRRRQPLRADHRRRDAGVDRPAIRGPARDAAPPRSVARSTCPSWARPARSRAMCSTRSPSGRQQYAAAGGGVPVITLACRVVARQRSRRRRLARRPRAGRHRPRQLHVRRRPPRRGHRLGARALG